MLLANISTCWLLIITNGCNLASGMLQPVLSDMTEGMTVIIYASENDYEDRTQNLQVPSQDQDP
jgi:hypothetical protein